MLTLDRITEIFCIADEFCKSFAIEAAKQPKLLAEDGKKHRKDELLSFCFTPGNIDDRDLKTLLFLTKKLFGKLFADKGYISKSLFEMLFNQGIHLITGVKSNIKNRLMPLWDRILLRKRAVIETINDMLKNICDVEHSRHRSINMSCAYGNYI